MDPNALTRTWTVPADGTTVTLARGWNTNNSERTDVTGVVVGTRAMIVVIDTVGGPFAGEGVWGYAHDIALLADEDDDDNECEGHESLRGDAMGASVFCDGSCVTR